MMAGGDDTAGLIVALERLLAGGTLLQGTAPVLKRLERHVDRETLALFGGTGWPDVTDASVPATVSAQDQLLLLEKATELMSAEHVRLAVVLLSRGRTATLLSHPVSYPDGTHGTAVEAGMEGKSWRVTSTVGSKSTVPRITHRTEPIAVSQPRATANPPMPTESRATDRWLLAVSEPGIGRLILQARERLSLLCDAGSQIGTTLDVTRTARELTEVAVPRFADYATVDLPECVLRGDEPATLDAGLRRVALMGAEEGSDLFPVGALIHPLPYTPQARSVATGRPILESALPASFGWMAQDPERGGRICDHGIHSLVAVPMRARGITLGVVNFYRAAGRDTFEEDDLSLAVELVNRAGVCVDNARRYTRERRISAELAVATTSLQHALDHQRRFTADASHELRTPLAGLRAQLEEAELHPGETDLADLLRHTLGDVDRLQAIITDLLSLARIGGPPCTTLEPVDLAELVEAETSRRIGDPHPTRLDLVPGVMANAVPIQIYRVLNNLLNNSQRHATHQVTVAVRRTAGMAELSVTDDGPGVPAAERERIFQPFTRLDTARSRDRGGTGLGLAIARDIAHAHRGTLHVEDASPNGARFVLRLPLA